eukprot:1340317-Amphidinium_carterae.1
MMHQFRPSTKRIYTRGDEWCTALCRCRRPTLRGVMLCAVVVPPIPHVTRAAWCKALCCCCATDTACYKMWPWHDNMRTATSMEVGTEVKMRDAKEVCRQDLSVVALLVRAAAASAVAGGRGAATNKDSGSTQKGLWVDCAEGAWVKAVVGAKSRLQAS